ncbi:hypothetical protein Tco_0947536 [Tanacetum coccineum]
MGYVTSLLGMRTVYIIIFFIAVMFLIATIGKEEPLRVGTRDTSDFAASGFALPPLVLITEKLVTRKIRRLIEPAKLNPSPPTSALRNMVGKGNEQALRNPNRPVSDTALREYCDEYYHQLLLIIAEKVHQEKVQQEKLKEVKARLNFTGCSRRNSKIQEVSQHSEIRRGRPESPRHRLGDKEIREGGVFDRLRGKGKNVFAPQRAVTKVPIQEKRDPFPENVTMQSRYLSQMWSSNPS